jgi:hypothetical protein
MLRHRRRNFSNQTKRDAFDRSGGICECHLIPWLKRPDGCGVKLVTGAIFYEHIKTDFHSSDNSLDNCAVLSRTCWKEKTSEHDIPSIAKTKRLIDSARGIKKPRTITAWRKFDGTPVYARPQR